jgi:ABC-type antimicrobial peptide transport system permease subunit
MEELIGRSLFLRRLYSGMTTVFALIAVVMAMSGLYGVMAYVVGDRTREFGIRLALGAQARDLLRLVSRDGVRLASIGIGIGVIGGVMAGFAVSGLLVGVSPIDPPVLAGTTALLGFVVAVACLVPARRAARLNLLDVLGAE